jgi:Skp family chaperone for outer membrane proteins
MSRFTAHARNAKDFRAGRTSTRQAALGIAMAGLLVLGGCSRGTDDASATDSPPPATADSPNGWGIAVVDLNEVARQIGAFDKIDHSLGEIQGELANRLNDLKAQLDEEYSRQRDQLPTDLNETQQSQLDALLTRHQQNLRQQTQLAYNHLATQHDQLKLRLINEVRSVAYEVAHELGRSYVFTSAQLYAADPRADITQKVIERINERNQAAQAKANGAGPPSVPHVAELPGGGQFNPY